MLKACGPLLSWPLLGNSLDTIPILRGGQMYTGGQELDALNSRNEGIQHAKTRFPGRR